MSVPLLIADVPWLLYRAFFALPDSIVDGEGRPVNALLGTVNALLAAVEARAPRAVAACFGAEQAAYRVELYPPYHAHRDPMPEALAQQWTRAPELLASLGWTVSASEELEADDVMFSYANAETASGGRALLLTGDRDLFQVVGPRAAILELPKGGDPAEIGPEQVRERYGIGPELVADFIALRGDPSDGLPGAPGIGAKTARDLLVRYGSLEETLAEVRRSVTAERPRVAAALRENGELLRAFKDIATLRHVEVERPADAVTDFAAGARAARELRMNGLAKRLEGMLS
ncbi:MAG TPA: 5'-3' exonuclease H3TH domain-containing protein [Solirubrobacteraceae bacterium]|jgi:5'-3' exonuclease|nr:5'-3' exonuclease H3TH domain-containing protein [Solirubrobacteraceae bacterium]